MKYAILAFAGVAALAAAPVKDASQTFTGIISDNMCLANGHASMRMGPTDAECTAACNQAHGAPYVLVVGKTAYGLSNQRTPEAFAAQKVRVVGTLDAKTGTIAVDSIVLAPASK